MKRLIFAILFISSLIIGIIALVYAEDKCTDWMPQPNGCYWRTCVDSEGRQYCEQCCGKVCSRVKCN